MAKPGAVSPNEDGLRDIPPIPDNTGMSTERMGLLSFTLSPSPVARWILPARVRNHRHNDVVVVGNTYIQLREFHENGQLSDVTTKLDLGIQIMGAKVISAHFERVPKMDLIKQQEYDEERWLVNGQRCPDDHPPQIVVLATASNEMIYIYAKNMSNNSRVEFVFAKRAMLGDTAVPPTYMRYMAIDLECKVMAVASYSSCTVFSLKDINELKTNIDAFDPRKPQSFQPCLEVDGQILKMDFLRASEEEPHKAILLLVVVNNKTTLLLHYVWDIREPLDQIRPMSDVVQSLPQGDNFPILLIPSMLPRSYIIVTEKSITFYDRIEPPTATILPGSSFSGKLWVQWARPVRLETHKREREEILLADEDGYLMMLNRNYLSDARIPDNYSPGDMSIGIDTAVCMLPGPLRMGGDIMIVGGSMCDGNVVHLKARKDLDLIQAIPNVSPIHDLATIDSSTMKQKDARTRRTFVTAGIRGTSSLNELRYGHEAQVGWTIPVEESATIDRIWTFEHVKKKTLFIMASHPEHTTAIILDLQTQKFEALDPANFPGLKFDAATFAVAMLPSNVSIQISPNRISAGFETSTPKTKNLDNCICADIDHHYGTFAIACKAEVDYQVQVGLVGKVQDDPSIVLSSTSYPATNRPSCLTLLTLHEAQYVAIGYIDGGIEVLLIDIEGTLTSQAFLPASETETSAITSIAVLGSPALPHSLILTGTRLGKLRAYKVALIENNNQRRMALTLHRTFNISDTPVRVVREHCPLISETTSAFVQGGSRLDRVICFENEHDVDYMLVNVWLSDKSDLTYTHPFINAVQQIQRLESIGGGVPSHFLICATEEDIVFARLIEQEQVVPRRLTSDDTGVSLMKYSKLLNKFIVANNPSLTYKFGSSSNVNVVQYTTLQLIDCDGTVPSHESPVQITPATEQEKICFIMPWEPTDGKNHFDLVMIGLNSNKSSRLGFISARKLLAKSTSPIFKQVARYANRKLHAICAIDKSSFVVSVGKTIVLVRLDIVSKKWHEDGVYALPSPALSLAAQGSVLYVATESHSTIMVSWNKATRKWEKVFTDKEAKRARIVLPFGVNGDHLLAAMANDDGTSVLAYPMNQSSLHKPAPLFEARMPHQLKHITIATSSWSENRQYAFQGIAFDGTMYIFQTLTYSEWRLLHFIEKLAHPDVEKVARRQVSLLSDKMARNAISAEKIEKGTRLNPRKMHVNGDVLQRLVDKGPRHLQSLLSSDVKQESELRVESGHSSLSRLQTLAGPVLGEPSDLPAAMIAWMRKLLRATIF